MQRGRKEASMKRLEGRVAIVTGAAGGIGKGIADEYAREGAQVVILDRNAAGAEITTAEIEAAGGQARAVAVDVTDYERIREIRDALLSEFGRIDILVNNAAIQFLGDLFESTLEQWRTQIAVDLEAIYMISKLVAEAMVTRNTGRIIHISSIQAFMTSGSLGAYNAAKAGVVGLTHSMAFELAPYGILVNAIAPGYIRTSMSIRPDGTDETQTEEFRETYIRRRRIPLGRAGLPQDRKSVV